MSKQYPGGIVSKNAVVPTSLSASGIWTLDQVADAQATNTWPFPRDPQFNYVTMLLHGDGSALGTTGAGAGASPTQTPFTFDASTNNFNVTINGDTKPNNFNPYQLGYYSNYFSVTAYLSTTGNATTAMGTGDFTWECWVFVPAATTYQTFIDTRSNPAVGTSDGFYFGLNTGTLTPVIFTTSLLASSSINVTANAWNHVAITRVGTTLTFWVNGASGGTVTNSTNLSNQFVYVGGSTASSVNLTGYLSNVRMVKGTALYSTAFTPSRTPLTAISGTSLLACQANRFIDSSSNAFTFTVTGSPQVAYAQPFTLPSSVVTYGSAYFDGSGDYLLSPDNEAIEIGNSDFTIEGWIFPTANTTNTYYCWVGKMPDNNYGVFYFPQRNGNLYIFMSYAGSTWNLNGVSSNYVFGAMTINAWNHFAITRSGDTIRGFMNGVLGSTISLPTGQSFYNNTNPLSLGAQSAGTEPVAGYISNFRFVKGTALYTSAFTPPTNPLTAVTNTSLLTTQFNGGSNNSGFKDASQFNFPITRVGNTTQGSFTPYGSNWSNYFGSGNYLTLSPGAAFAFGTGDFTVECFVYINSFPSNPGSVYFIDSRNAGQTNTWIFLTSADGTNSARLDWYTGSSAISGPTLPSNTWLHLVYTRASSTYGMFVNGVRVATGTDSTNYSVSPSTSYIASRFTADNILNGYMNGLRVVKGSSVYSPSSSTLTVPTTPLTAITNTVLLTCQSNRFVDNSASPYTLTVNGSPSVQRFSPFAPSTAYNASSIGGATYFDGSGDYLSVPSGSVSLAGDFTVEGWLYRTTASGNGNYLLGLGNDTFSSGATFFVDTSGYLRIYTGQAHLLAGTSGLARLNSWNHIAFVRSSNTLRAYLNGVQVDSASWSASISGVAYINAELNGNPTATVYPGSAGYLSNLRINTTAVYTGTFVPSTTALTAITGTQLFLSYTNAGIFDNAMLNNLETVGNAQVSTSVKKYGTGSMYFDGTSSSLTIYSNLQNLQFGTGDFTIESWVNKSANGANGYDTLIGLGSTSSATQGWYLEVSSTRGIFFVINNVSVSFGTWVNDGLWHHIAVTRSNGTVYIFKDGLLLTSGSLSTAVPTTATAARIGNYYNGTTNYYYSGYIDDLRITNGFARYTANFTPPDQAFPNG